MCVYICVCVCVCACVCVCVCELLDMHTINYKDYIKTSYYFYI